ncbi:MAG: hypothetical protein JO133_07435 [Burkholderiaceae bacterium]|nr:hypothetical protein [Burkholderiaceae bacterium]
MKTRWTAFVQGLGALALVVSFQSAGAHDGAGGGHSSGGGGGHAAGHSGGGGHSGVSGWSGRGGWSRGFDGHHHHFHGGFDYGFGVWGPGWGWDPWWGWDYYYAPAYPVYGPDYGPDAVAPPAPPPTDDWYYCPPAKAYYPYVRDCPVPWVPVTPTPPR